MTDTPNRYYAAMYHDIGNRCQLSASGITPIFKKEWAVNGRQDLSGDEEMARRHLKAVGIDPDLLTDDKVQEYLEWRDRALREHEVANASIHVTSPRGMLDRHVGNQVQLRVGASPIAVVAAKCIEYYDPDAKNLMGGKGAFKNKPNIEKVQKAVDRLRRDHPEFSDAPITGNKEATEGVT